MTDTPPPCCGGTGNCPNCKQADLISVGGVLTMCWICPNCGVMVPREDSEF